MRLVLGLSLALFLAMGCGSKKVSLDEPEKFEKDLNTSTVDKNEKVGVKDNTVVIQKRVYLEEELSRLHTVIEDLENNIYGKSKKDPGGLFLGLKECRRRISDPRLGGSGTPQPMEKWEKISEKEPDYNFAVDKKKNVIAYSEEKLEQKIVNLQKMKNILEDKFDSFKDKVDTCETNYRTALINHGMKPEDGQAKGEWVDGPNGQRVWKMVRPSSDDPEEIMKRKNDRESKKQQ